MRHVALALWLCSCGTPGQGEWTVTFVPPASAPSTIAAVGSLSDAGADCSRVLDGGELRWWLSMMPCAGVNALGCTHPNRQPRLVEVYVGELGRSNTLGHELCHVCIDPATGSWIPDDPLPDGTNPADACAARAEALPQPYPAVALASPRRWTSSLAEPEAARDLLDRMLAASDCTPLWRSGEVVFQTTPVLRDGLDVDWATDPTHGTIVIDVMNQSPICSLAWALCELCGYPDHEGAACVRRNSPGTCGVEALR